MNPKTILSRMATLALLLKEAHATEADAGSKAAAKPAECTLDAPVSPEHFLVILRDLSVEQRDSYYDKHLKSASKGDDKKQVLGAMSHWDTLKSTPATKRSSDDQFMKTLQTLPTRKEREAYCTKYQKELTELSPTMNNVKEGALKQHLDLLDKHDAWKKKNLPGGLPWLWIGAAVFGALILGVVGWHFCSKSAGSTDPDIEVD